MRTCKAALLAAFLAVLTASAYADEEPATNPPEPASAPATAAPAAPSAAAAQPAAADSYCPECRRPVTWEQDKCPSCGTEFEPLKPRVKKGEGQAEPAAAPAPAAPAPAGGSPFERPPAATPEEKLAPQETIIPSPWKQIQPPADSRFGLASYGRVGIDLESNLRGAKPLDIADYRPILGKSPYAELHFFYKDKLNELPVLIKTTLAFDQKLFHYDGDWDTRMCVRELYAEVSPTPDLALWVGARMYRGDNVYLLDFWPLDDQNTLGGGAALRLGEIHRLQAHVGVNRIVDHDTFFYFQEIDLPVEDSIDTRQAIFLDRNRGVASLTYALELPEGFKAKVHGEGHYVPSGTRRNETNGLREHLPADHGFLIGGELGASADNGSFANLFVRYATGLAAYDELEIPYGFASDYSVTDAERILVALGGALESPYVGAHFGAYWQRFFDADGKDDHDDSDQYVVAVRPLAYLGQYFRLGFEFSWQGVERKGVFPETGSEEFMQLTKLTLLAGVAPRPGVFARPELYVFYGFKWLNTGTTLELGRTRFIEPPDKDEQSFGVLAEWWF